MEVRRTQDNRRYSSFGICYSLFEYFTHVLLVYIIHSGRGTGKLKSDVEK